MADLQYNSGMYLRWRSYVICVREVWLSVAEPHSPFGEVALVITTGSGSRGEEPVAQLAHSRCSQPLSQQLLRTLCRFDTPD